MSICVSDIPIGANMRFVFADKVIEGRVIHNYGVGIVLNVEDGLIMEINGQLATRIEAMDKESGSMWRQSISNEAAKFKQMLERMKSSAEDSR